MCATNTMIILARDHMCDSCEPIKLASGHDNDRPNRVCDADKTNRKKLCQKTIRVHSLSVVISSVLSHARNAASTTVT
jgi:hypothetical protein